MSHDPIDHPSRRKFMRGLLLGAGGLGLKAAASGLPVSFLADPLAARAQDALAVDPSKAQYLILSMSDGGEPINNTCPGSYDFPDMIHANHDSMAPVPVRMGSTTKTGAYVWSTLPQWVLDRTAFMNHATFANNHGMLAKVLRLMGRTKGSELIPSIYAKHLAKPLETLQDVPIACGAGEFLVSGGVRIPNTSPLAWRELLGQYRPADPAAVGRVFGAGMAQLRDQAVDEMYAILKERGTPSQLHYLDQLAKSRTQAKQLGEDVGDLMDGVEDDGGLSQMRAAVAIIRMNLAPVVAINLRFGQDNHTDNGLLSMEVPQHQESMAVLNEMFSLLQSAGLEDRVTFAYFGVFGRNFRVPGRGGRDHWGNHCVSMMVGKNVRPGIIGGAVAGQHDYDAAGIDPATGDALPSDRAPIPFNDTLAAVGKTMGAVLGISEATMDEEVSGGHVVRGALNA